MLWAMTILFPISKFLFELHMAGAALLPYGCLLYTSITLLEKAKDGIEGKTGTAIHL